MKKIAVACACLGLFLAGGFAQQGATVYESDYAKVTFFNSHMGFDLVGVSADGKFFYGSSSAGTAFIYDVAAGQMHPLNETNIGLLAVKDLNNYATTSYTMLDGIKHSLSDEVRDTHIELDVEAASGDLKTLFAGYYDAGSVGYDAYSSVRIDAESGEILDTLPWVYPQMQTAGYMNRSFGASQDGKIVVGTSSAPFAFTNTSPVFWDLEAGRSFYVGIGEDREAGTTEGALASCNNDGTLMCGYIGNGRTDRAYVFRYDKATYSFERVAVPLWAGSSTSMAYAVSETGLVVGSEDAKTFLFDMTTGEKYEMTEYLRYLYGVELPEDAIPFNTTGGISDNGRIFAGTGNPNAEVPYLIELGERQLHATARTVTARQNRGTETVAVTWNKPILGQYTLKGYWIYRDSVKVNAEMLAADEFSFTDQKVPGGLHTYAVQAVYDDGEEAEYAFAPSIRVTTVDGCLPVQEIYSSILYNRTVNLFWGLPSDKAPEASVPAAKAPAAKVYTAQNLDMVDMLDMKSTNASAAVRIGNYIYVTAFQSDIVTIFNALSGEVEKTVEVADFKGAYDLTSHGHSIYAVSNDHVVRELTIDPDDPFDVQMGTYWYTKLNKMTHIAYVENKNGEDYFALGAYNNVMFYPVAPLNERDTLAGSEKFNFRAYAIGGSEAYDGKLYVANQSSLSGSEVVAFDLATGEKVSTDDLNALPQMASVTGNVGMIVSGLTRCTLEDGMVELQCMVQPRAMTAQNVLVNMELESWPETLGYNVYRKEKGGEEKVKVNDALVKARHFSDVVYEAGVYEYTIEYVSNRCQSSSEEANVSEEVTINPIGECEKPGAVKAVEVNNQVLLTWTHPTASTWVGINIYRNGEQKVEFLRDERWLDIDKLQKDSRYVYKVEAFYDNSCVASDSVVITPTFQGTAMPPANVNLSARKNSDDTYAADLSWELPYFEQPMAYGYCGAPARSLTPQGVSTVFALIGWDAESIPVFEDLYLVGMEYMVGTTDLVSLDGVVYVDNRIVHTQQVGERFRKEEWNTLLFNHAIPMTFKTELAVGYIASWNPDEIQGDVLMIDAGPGRRAFSDILSYDGKTSTTLAAAGYDANLCINALIVRRRDMEAAASAPDPAAYLQEKMIRTDMPWKVASSSELTSAPKTTSETIKLRGFNVYDQDTVKLNESMLSGFAFTQGVVRDPQDDGYMVGAVYDGMDDQLSDIYYLDLSNVANDEAGEAFGLRIYPNPVGEALHVAGEYRSLIITDLSGKRVGGEMRNAETVSMTALQSGVYLLHFTLPDGRNLVVKVVKR